MKIDNEASRIFTLLPHPIAVIDEHFNFITCSEPFRNFFQIDPTKEIVGDSFFDTISDLEQEIKSHFQNALVSGKSLSISKLITLNHYFNINLTPIEDDNIVTGLLISIDDITKKIENEKLIEEAKEHIKNVYNKDFTNASVAEVIYELEAHQEELLAQNEELTNSYYELDKVKKEFSDLFNFSPLPSIIINKEGNIRTWNLEATILFPILSRSTKERVNFLNLIKKEFTQEVLTFLKSLKKVKKGSIEVELLRGKTVIISAYLTEQYAKVTKSDEDLSFQFMMQDVTELREYQSGLEKKVNEEVRKSKEFKSKLNEKTIIESQNQLLKSISHHWRNPLNVISIGLTNIKQELANKELSGDFIENHIDDIHKQLFALSSSIETFSSVNRDSDTVVEFNIVELIWHLHELVNPLRDSRNIACGCNLPTAPVIYYGDKSLLTQVLLTLFHNAVDSIERQQTIEPEFKDHKIAFSISEDEDTYKIHVKDTGDKFSKTALEKLFQPYSSTYKLTSGAGLGLYSAYNIIGSMGGEMEIKNQKIGSEVIISLLKPQKIL